MNTGAHFPNPQLGKVQVPHPRHSPPSPRAAIRPESRFMEDLGFTSFDFMSMLGELEDEFETEIDQQEAAGIRTVQEAADYLEKLTKEA